MRCCVISQRWLAVRKSEGRLRGKQILQRRKTGSANRRLVKDKILAGIKPIFDVQQPFWWHIIGYLTPRRAPLAAAATAAAVLCCKLPDKGIDQHSHAIWGNRYANYRPDPTQPQQQCSTIQYSLAPDSMP